MIGLLSGAWIWLAAGLTGLRRGVNGPAALTKSVLKKELFGGHDFVFRGRRGDIVKLLWCGVVWCGGMGWGGQGMCLFAKRPKKGRHPVASRLRTGLADPGAADRAGPWRPSSLR